MSSVKTSVAACLALVLVASTYYYLYASSATESCLSPSDGDDDNSGGSSFLSGLLWDRSNTQDIRRESIRHQRQAAQLDGEGEGDARPKPRFQPGLPLSRLPFVLDRHLPSYAPGARFNVRRCGYANKNVLPWYNPSNFNSTTTPDLLRPTRTSPVFLYGCGHSGTTWIFESLAKHRNIYGEAENPVSRETLLKKAYFSFTAERDKRDVYRRLARAAGKMRWLIKAPKYACQLGYILKNVPEARLIFMVRDGRDVLMSLVRRFRNEYPPATLLQRWVNDNLAALFYANDPRVLTVFYEDVVKDPIKAFSTILIHIGESPDREDISEILRAPDPSGVMSVKDRPDAEPDGGGGAGHAQLREWQSNQPLFNDTMRWRIEPMSSELKAAFKENEDAMKLLHFFGYWDGKTNW